MAYQNKSFLGTYREEGTCIHNHSLAIFDSDFQYAHNLMEYMNRKGKLSLQISAFSNIEYLLEYTGQNKIDILLLEAEQVSHLGEKEHNIHNIYLLSESKGIKTSLGYSCIYKYQSAEAIVKELIHLSLENDGGQGNILQISTQSKTEIIGVFSPDGSSQRTDVCMSICRYCGKRGRTLYLNLEMFCQVSWLLLGGEAGFSELLYYMKQRNTALLTKVHSLVCNSDGFDIIPPVRHYQDLLEMNAEDALFLTEALKDYSDYEYVVMDIGLGGGSLSALLNQSDRIYLVTSDYYLCQDKKEAFYKQLREGSSLRNKIKEIMVPFPGHRKESWEEDADMDRILEREEGPNEYGF